MTRMGKKRNKEKRRIGYMITAAEESSRAGGTCPIYRGVLGTLGREQTEDSGKRNTYRPSLCVRAYAGGRKQRGRKRDSEEGTRKMTKGHSQKRRRWRRGEKKLGRTNKLVE